MKVLQFLDSVNRGGAETQVLDLCRNASRFGIEVTFVTAGAGVMEDEFRNSSVEFIRLDRKLPVDLCLASQLRQIVKERDIRIVHGYQAVDGLHLWLATRGVKAVKRVLSFQGFIPGRKNRITAKLVASKMDANISVSKSLIKYLRDEVGMKRFGNFHVVYNGADEARLKPSGKSMKAELELPSDATLGAMIANFTADPTKDQLTVCRALVAAVEKHPNFHFLFAGRVADGAEETMADCVNACIEGGIAENVHFLGARSDVADILSGLDLFVFSSRREGFPLAVCEAMLAGVPLIVSDIEPLREAVRDGEFGELFPVGNVGELSDRITERLNDAGRRAELSVKAKTYARANFSIDAHLTSLRDLYSSLLIEKD